MASVTFSFCVDTQHDRNLVRYLEGIPKRKRSERIRAALYQYMGEAVTLGDVYQELAEIKRAIRSGAVVQSSGDVGEDQEADDPRVARAKDAIADLGL